jgi:hypothetical protein
MTGFLKRFSKTPKIKDDNTQHFLVLFPLSDSPASEFYVPTLRNTLFHLHRRCKQEGFFLFRRPGITQKKEQNTQNTAKF